MLQPIQDNREPNQLLCVESALNKLAVTRAKFLARYSDEWLCTLADDLANGRAPSVPVPEYFPRMLELLAVPSLLLELRRRLEVAELETGF